MRPSFIIVNPETWYIRGTSGCAKTYNTEQGAKAALTRIRKKEPDTKDVVMSYIVYNQVRPMVERTNMMSGEKYLEPAGTPNFLSPSSETYWSM